MKTDLGLIDWAVAHRESLRQGVIKASCKEASAFVDFLWPAGVEYYSPLNPAFLMMCSSPEALNTHPIWTARDGLVPLLWYFRHFPKPGRFNRQLLVHEDFAPYVPRAWHPVTGTYRVDNSPGAFAAPSKLKPEAGPRRKLFLSGILMDTWCSIERLRELLLRIPTDAYAEIVVFMPGRIEGFGNEHRHEFQWDFITSVCARLGSKIKAINWKQLEGFDNLADYDVVEFNENLLCVDSYLLHLALRRGGRLLMAATPRARAKGESFVPISPTHGMRVNMQIDPSVALLGLDGAEGASPVDERSAQYVARLHKAMRSEANQRFPWPTWFNAVVRNHVAARRSDEAVGPRVARIPRRMREPKPPLD